MAMIVYSTMWQSSLWIASTVLRDFLSLFYIVPIIPNSGDAVWSSVDDVPDYIGRSIPYFLLLVVLEWLYGVHIKRQLYTFKDTVMSISLGIVQQLGTLWMKELALLPYVFLFEACAPLRSRLLQQSAASDAFTAVATAAAQTLGVQTTITSTSSSNTTGTMWLLFFLGFLGCDLGYYLMHRSAHEWHLLWCGHSVHHSGERFNLATALRQGVFQPIYSWMFYLFLAVLGLPPVHFVRHNRLNTVFQFWIHTETIGRLPWLLELLLNSPSHHRVHHRPPGNCNYAGVLIVWDRIFCSFVSEYSLPVTSVTFRPTTTAGTKTATTTTTTTVVMEIEESHRGVLYGLAKPLDSYDPVYANLSHFNRVAFGASKDNNSSISSDNSSIDYSSSSSGSIAALLYQVLLFLPKWRIHKRWRLARSLDEFMPDILHEWRQETIAAASASSSNNSSNDSSLQQRWHRTWDAFWALPPEVTAAAEVCAQENETLLLSQRDWDFLRGRKKREEPRLSAVSTAVVTAHFVATLIISFLILELSGDVYFRAFKSQLLLLQPMWTVSTSLQQQQQYEDHDNSTFYSSSTIENSSADTVSSAGEVDGMDASASATATAVSALTAAVGVSLLCIASVLSLQTIKLHYNATATTRSTAAHVKAE